MSDIDALTEQIRYGLERRRARRVELLHELAALDAAIPRIEAALAALTDEEQPCPTTTAAPTTSCTPATSAPSSTAWGWIAPLTTEEPETTGSSSTSPEDSSSGQASQTEDIPPTTDGSTPTTSSPTSALPAAEELLLEPSADVFASLRATQAEKDRTKAERLTHVAEVANAALREGRNPILAVANDLDVKISTAGVYVSEARRAGHNIPRVKIPAEPVREPEVPVHVAYAVPTHREIADVVNKATADNIVAIDAVAMAFNVPWPKAEEWIESCRGRGMLVDPTAWTVDQAREAIAQQLAAEAS